MPNYIRVKQINQGELTDFFVNSISSQSSLLTALASEVASGIILNETVLLTGNQTISGIKTFNVAPIVSGNQLITGNLSLYATNVNLASTGSTLTSSINSTGSNLVDNINSLSGYINSTKSNIIFTTGDQSISGNKTFLNNLNVSGDVTIAGTLRYNEIIDTTVTGNISGYTGIFQELYANNLVYNTGDQTINGNKTFLNNFIVSGTGSAFPILQITGVNDILINGNSSFGNYIIRDPVSNHKLFKTNYLRNSTLQGIQISGLKTNNIINVFAEDMLTPGNDPNVLTKSYQYMMVDGPIPNSYNAINITGGLYSGKGLRRLKTGPTIANGYKNIPSLQYGGATITPKQKYLETVYNITVESGKGAIRPLTFITPNITTANNPIITLKFNFQADTGVCIVSGRYQDSTPIFTITGANYDFIQTERLMFHFVQGAGGTYVRI